MIFIETPVFTEDMLALMPDDSYAELQTFLAAQPDAGDVIQARVIYYWRVSESQILMLAIYGKGTRADLSSGEKKLLRKIVERWS